MKEVLKNCSIKCTANVNHEAPSIAFIIDKGEFWMLCYCTATFDRYFALQTDIVLEVTLNFSIQ